MLGVQSPASALGGDPEAYGQWVGGYWHGSYWEGSALVYCLDQSKPTPYGRAMMGSARATAGWRGLDGNRLAGLNWLLGTHGASTDPMTARSVQEAVWAITGTEISGSRTPLADEMIAAVHAYRAEPTSREGTARILVALAPDGRTGTVTIDRLDAAPSSAAIKGRIELVNAVFRGGTSVRTGTFTRGQTFQIDVVPPSDKPRFRVEATITATSEHTVYAPWITYIDYDTGTTFQEMVAAIRSDKREQVVHLEDLGRSDVIDRSFQPVATTRVTAEVVNPGEAATDRVEVSVSSGSWADGVRVTFVGTAYGMSRLAAPTRSSAIPSGATEIGTVRITADKPGSYVSPAVTVPDRGVSHIVWVWRMLRSEQSEPAKSFVLGDWRDDFAVPAETQLVRFQPKLTTSVSSRIVQPGQAFVDVVEASAASGYWPPGLAVTARGTLYGPLSSPPSERATAPTNAAVAGRAAIVMDRPKTYRTDGSIVATSPGYYTWVWEIDAAEQSADARKRLRGSFLDRYALAAETHVVPSRFEISTKVAKPVLAVGDPAVDTIAISSVGTWPRLDGGAASLVLTGEAWYVEREERPSRQRDVPSDAVLLGTVSHTVSGAGRSSAPAVAAPSAPSKIGASHGWIVWVWRLDPAKQTAALRERITAWRDDFGMPDEIQRVDYPSVTTAAVPGVGFGLINGVNIQDRGGPTSGDAASGASGGDAVESMAMDAPGRVAQTSVPVHLPVRPPVARDTATITGPVPAAGATLVFEAFAVPMGDDGLPLDPTLESGCTPERLIATVEHPHVITDPGEYTSPEVELTQYGLVVWRASLVARSGGGDGAVIAREQCGMERETTVVVDLATTATISGSSPQPLLSDEAVILGYVPADSTLRFDAYRHEPGERVDCAPDQLAWTSGELRLDGGMYGHTAPLVVSSDAWRPESLPAGVTVSWIATLTDAMGRVLAAGDCAEPSETVVVPEKPREVPPPPAPPTSPPTSSPPPPSSPSPSPSSSPSPPPEVPEEPDEPEEPGEPSTGPTGEPASLPTNPPPALAWTGDDGRKVRALGAGGIGLIATGLLVGALAGQWRAAAAGPKPPRRSRTSGRGRP